MSAPSKSTIVTGLRYKDAHAAIDWLCRALGFARHVVFEGPSHTIAHAQLTFGSGMIMLGSASNPGDFAQYMIQPEETGGRETQACSLITSDAASLYQQAKAAGADIVMEIREMDYGGKAFTVRDPEGHIWSVGEYDPWAHVPQTTID